MGPGMVRVPEGANEAGSAPEARRPAPSEQRDLRPTVEILEERYDDLLAGLIRGKGRQTDEKLIRSAALAKKDSYVLSAMAEGKRLQALTRRLTELVEMPVDELARIANEPMPKAAPEAAVRESAEPGSETRVETQAKVEIEAPPAPESEIQNKLEHLSSVAPGKQNFVKDIVVQALGSKATDWSKVDEGYLENVEFNLRDLRMDKQKAAPEFPFLKVNRINKALEDVKKAIYARNNRRRLIEIARLNAERIARGPEATTNIVKPKIELSDAEVEMLRAQRKQEAEEDPFLMQEQYKRGPEATTNIVKPKVELSESEVEVLRAQRKQEAEEDPFLMQEQYKIKSKALDDLKLKLDDYLKIAGLFGGLRSHARALKREIRSLEEEQDKLMRAIDERRVTSRARGSITTSANSRERNARITDPSTKMPDRFR